MDDVFETKTDADDVISFFEQIGLGTQQDRDHFRRWSEPSETEPTEGVLYGTRPTNHACIAG